MTMTRRRIPRATEKTRVRDLVFKLRASLGAPGGKRASREKTARHLKVSPGTIYNWEHGLSLPTTVKRAELEAAAAGSSLRSTMPAEALSVMAHAVHVCGSVDRARDVFDRVAGALSS